jgi:hypothetical protein
VRAFWGVLGGCGIAILVGEVAGVLSLVMAESSRKARASELVAVCCAPMASNTLHIIFSI